MRVLKENGTLLKMKCIQASNKKVGNEGELEI
jgi:hypothetical protein